MNDVPGTRQGAAPEQTVGSQTGAATRADDDAVTAAPYDPSMTAAFAPAVDPSLTMAPSVTGDDDTEFTVTGAAARAAAPPGYDITGILGRGGMGVVYRAQQRSLKRTVALKMVTAGAHAGPDHLARFQAEAEAVASLQHPNIVQIYEVGEHDGVPFFSLEYVDGGTLSGLVEKRPLAPRKAAELTRTLARAMHSAHQHGIVHRDLKPGNVLMTADGIPKITDFGLAKRTDVAEDVSRTAAGTIMGTPGYMAPEQALGDVKNLGPLTDVYSLGAVLYHLLTGRPPFNAATLLETLEQVRTQEPVPVRQLQPRTPRDLETVCLTCLAKEPRKRYADAEALARDLDHYLAGEPIEARPVGYAGRLWRWCRRNPGIATLTAAVFSLLVLVAGTSSYFWFKITKEQAKTETARRTAVEARGQAEANAALATEQGRLAVNTLYGVVTKVQQQLRSQPGNQKLRQDLLGDALAGLERVVSTSDAPLLRRTRAAAYQHMGDIARQLGRTEAAQKYFQDGLAVVEQMAADDPDSQVTRWNQAVLYDKLGDINLQLLGDGAVARVFFQKCLDVRKGLAAETPRDAELRTINVKDRLDNSYLKLGSLALSLGDPAGAWRSYGAVLQDKLGPAAVTPKDALAAVAARADGGKVANLAMCLRLGEAALHLGDDASARGWLDRALRTARAAKDPDSTGTRADLIAALAALGDLEVRVGDAARALEHYQSAHEITEKVAAADPEGVAPRRALALSHYRLGAATARLGRDDDARKHFTRCRELRQQLTGADPTNTYNQIDLMLITARCGDKAEASRRAAELRKRAAHDPAVLFFTGCTYALCAGGTEGPNRAGYLDSAFESLDAAVKAGYRDPIGLRTDPDLAAAREDPRFTALLGRLGGSTNQSAKTSSPGS